MLLVRALVGTAVNISVNTSNPLPTNSFSKIFFLAPRYYGLSLIRTPNRGPESVRNNVTGVDCTLYSSDSGKLENVGYQTSVQHDNKNRRKRDVWQHIISGNENITCKASNYNLVQLYQNDRAFLLQTNQNIHHTIYVVVFIYFQLMRRLEEDQRHGSLIQIQIRVRVLSPLLQTQLQTSRSSRA